MAWWAWIIYPLLGAITGLIAWGNSSSTMPIALVIFPLFFYAPNRWIAWAVVFCYFMAAGHGLLLASIQYFQSDFLSAFFDLTLACLIPSLPFFFLYFAKKIHRLAGLVIASVIIMIPPFGLTCCTHPLASTGFWLPGFGWLGLILALAMIPFFCRWPVLLTVPLVVGLTNNQTSLSPPSTWGNIDTHFSGQPGRRNNFADLRFNLANLDQQAKTVLMVNQVNKDIQFLLLPESSGGNWSVGVDLLWQSMLTWPGTVLVGTTIPAGNYKDNVIMAVARDKKNQIIYRQRQPVPVSMWHPGKTGSYLAHWFANPVVQVGDYSVAFIVCYEQFMTWLILHSAWQNPDIFAATSNVWWSAGTNIPIIQRNIMLAWSRLFSVPLITATNL